MSNNQNINDLHILAIAVNNYEDNDLKLKHSLNDADQIIETVQKVAKPIFNKIHTYKLFDKDVTKENIKNMFDKIKSTREDVFLLYIAGHGITDKYNGNYYYIPYDFTNSEDMKVIQSQGIGQKDLLLGLSKITALKSLVLLDTCESGSFVEANIVKNNQQIGKSNWKSDNQCKQQITNSLRRIQRSRSFHLYFTRSPAGKRL